MLSSDDDDDENDMFMFEVISTSFRIISYKDVQN